MELKELADEIIMGECQVNQYSRELVSLYEQYVYEKVTKEEFLSGKDQINEQKRVVKEYIEKCKKRQADLEISELKLKAVPVMGEKIDTFNEEAIRQVVSDIILDADQKVEVKFKDDPTFVKEDLHAVTDVKTHRDKDNLILW